MPLSVYVYMPLADFGYLSLVLGRLLSVIFLILSFFILQKLYLKYAKQLHTKPGHELLFSLLFFANLFLVNWAVTVRIYALSILFLSCAVYYFDKFKDDPKPKYIFVCGILLSMLVLTKIIFAVNVLVFILAALLLPGGNRKIRNFAVLVIAALLPIAVFFIAFLKYPDALYFNIFEVNVITKKFIDVPLTQGLIKFLGFFILPQNLILAAVIFLSGFKWSRFEKFLLLNIAGFISAHFFSRMLLEYMSSVTPLFILLASIRYGEFEKRITARFGFFSKQRLLWFTAGAYILLSPLSVEHFKHIFEKREINVNPLQLYTFEEKVNKLSGETVLSTWEGYSFFSGKTALMREHYGSAFIEQYFSDDDKKKFKIASKKDYENLILNKIPDIIIYDNSNAAHFEELKSFIDAGYRREFDYKTIIVYQRQ